jgi:hypothetical protein
VQEEAPGLLLFDRARSLNAIPRRGVATTRAAELAARPRRAPLSAPSRAGIALDSRDRRMHRTLARSTRLLALPLLLCATGAQAGVIADENGKPGLPGGWPVSRDGTANGLGVVDVYPAAWSIVTGDAVRLKIRSTTGFDLRVLRVGWYGGAGATEVLRKTGLPADPQPYVGGDAEFGLAEARWHDTVTIPTDASWTPGLYVARVEQSGGAQGETFFVLRDDGRASRAPFVMVLATATHAAYDTWPGPTRGGKSLYGFNSSDSIPDDSPSPAGAFNQALKVSFDRPFFVGGGTGDVGTWETPMLRFLERNGWDVAYATDVDLHARPDYFLGRKGVLFVGHSEYWSRGRFDHALAARDAGVNLLFATGNTLLWQVRFEPGAGGPESTMVCYKTSWRNDPEHQLGWKLFTAGDVEGAKPHFGLVTRLWKNLEYHPEVGLDARRSGMILTGVETAAAFSYWFPWADYVVREPTHWIYEGTGLKYDDRIRGVMGYEIDSTKIGDPTFDPWRPAGQVRLGTMIDKDGTSRGSSAYYKAASGAEVVALGAIAFSWSLDDFASGSPSTVDPRAQRMITNVLTRWSTMTPVPAPQGDAGADATDDAGAADAGVSGGDATTGSNEATVDRQRSTGWSCSGARASGGGGGGTWIAAIAIGLAMRARRRRAC